MYVSQTRDEDRLEKYSKIIVIDINNIYWVQPNNKLTKYEFFHSTLLFLGQNNLKTEDASGLGTYLGTYL